MTLWLAGLLLIDPTNTFTGRPLGCFAVCVWSESLSEGVQNTGLLISITTNFHHNTFPVRIAPPTHAPGPTDDS